MSTLATLPHTLTELDKEARMGGLGSETQTREIRRIDLSDFDARRVQIADELWAAATDVGFFQLVNHGIDLTQVQGAFDMAQRFFALPDGVKAQYPLQRALNSGWESRAQVRPSTGTQDQKESYQSTLRLLHYFPTDPSAASGLWRAGAHTDFDCLTLLFQRAGQGGLQLCPGKEMEGQQWTSIEPADDIITCNIGDMLMRWSDDQLPSNFHRVRNPLPHEYQGSRYSLAFFCQANRDVMIESPSGKYAPISAEAYLRQRVAANFRAGQTAM